jgi:hypothetical protein
MVWLLIGISICAIVIIAGRAHSRYLDRLEARLGAVVQIQLLSMPPDVVKQIESATIFAIETSEQLPVAVLSRIVVANEACVRSQEANNRGIEYEVRLISNEGELLETYDLREVAVAVSGVNAITNRDKESGRQTELELARILAVILPRVELECHFTTS